MDKQKHLYVIKNKTGQTWGEIIIIHITPQSIVAIPAGTCHSKWHFG